MCKFKVGDKIVLVVDISMGKYSSIPKGTTGEILDGKGYYYLELNKVREYDYSNIHVNESEIDFDWGYYRDKKLGEIGI